VNFVGFRHRPQTPVGRKARASSYEASWNAIATGSAETSRTRTPPVVAKTGSRLPTCPSETTGDGAARL
jgi:hypothetical protein